MLLDVGLAFFEGFALIISPCILPILPIILSGSLTGKKSRPIGIIIGFVITFTVVTLFSKAIISFLNLNPNTLRHFAFGILFLLGTIMMSTVLTTQFNLLTQALTRVGSSFEKINQPESGFISGLLFGGLVGIIWTPCAGPILAAVIVQVIIQQTTLSSLFVIIAFAVGAGVPMLLIAFIGRRLIDRFQFLRNYTELIRKILGAIIITSVMLLYFFPESVIPLNVPVTKVSQPHPSARLMLLNGVTMPYKAPEIAGISDWINSSPLQISQLKNKVILIDFWTYSCINCIRTLPYLKEWYAKYHDKGFIIIGVHSPEFQFEQELQNVQAAVAKFNILYPVALDNQFITWRNYQNQYWPAHYLINKEGYVVYKFFGEGEYDTTENNIRYLLGLSENQTSTRQQDQDVQITPQQTPETYLGFARANTFASPEAMVKNKISTYTYPDVLSENQWALKGDWIFYADKIVAASKNAAIKINFNARKVYAVMGAPNQKLNIKIISNENALSLQKGKNNLPTELTVSMQRLYTLLDSAYPKQAILEIIISNPGLEIYTFTFG